MSKPTWYKISIAANVFLTCWLPLSLTTGSIRAGFYAAIGVSIMKTCTLYCVNAAWRRWGNYVPYAKVCT